MPESSIPSRSTEVLGRAGEELIEHSRLFSQSISDDPLETWFVGSGVCSLRGLVEAVREILIDDPGPLTSRERVEMLSPLASLFPYGSLLDDLE